MGGFDRDSSGLSFREAPGGVGRIDRAGRKSGKDGRRRTLLYCPKGRILLGGGKGRTLTFSCYTRKEDFTESRGEKRSKDKRRLQHLHSYSLLPE